MVRPSRAYLRRAISALDMAERCGISRDKFRLIVNQAGPGIRPEEIAEALGLATAAVIPADWPGYLDAETSGKPYALTKPPKAVRAWSGLADRVYRQRER